MRRATLLTRRSTRNTTKDSLPPTFTLRNPKTDYRTYPPCNQHGFVDTVGTKGSFQGPSTVTMREGQQGHLFTQQVVSGTEGWQGFCKMFSASLAPKPKALTTNESTSTRGAATRLAGASAGGGGFGTDFKCLSREQSGHASSHAQKPRPPVAWICLVE